MSSPAFADPISPDNIPLCHLASLPDGTKICGYTVDEWKLVLIADRELSFLRKQVDALKEKGVNLSLQVAALEGEVTALRDSRSAFDARVSKLTNDLISCDRKLQSERVRSSFGDPIPWSISLLATSLLIGVVVGDYVLD